VATAQALAVELIFYFLLCIKRIGQSRVQEDEILGEDLQCFDGVNCKQGPAYIEST
jgi:hypothetical protein